LGTLVFGTRRREWSLRLEVFSRCCFVLLALLAVSGCGAGAQSTAPVAPEAPTGGLAKCEVAASHESPLVTEWPASEKANLESRLREGGVVVAYSGCEMRLLPGCRAGGSYEWRRTTTSTDSFEILTQDDLYTKLPLGAAALEGELSNSGRLAVRTTVSGQLGLTGADPGRIPITGACQGATHLVSGLSIGAFQLKTGGATSVSGGAEVGGLGATAGTGREEATLRSAGTPGTCMEATVEAPHSECRSPIQIFLTPLPAALRERPPEGTIRAAFISDEPEKTWQVVGNDRVLCETPCALFVPATQKLVLRERDPAWLRRAARIQVPRLKDLGHDSVIVHSHNETPTKLVLGIVGASVGGAGLMTGMLLTTLGCRDERGSTAACVSGIVTLPVAATLVAVSVVWMVTAESFAEVQPGRIQSLDSKISR
jgi:transposase